MKKVVLAIALILSTLQIAQARHSSYDYGSDVGTGSNQEHEHVSGYTKQDGTYVAPYERTKANDTLNDNYGTRGNENPWTGKTGTGQTDNDRQEKSNNIWGK